ncbi:MAG: hypothetical protein NC400_09655 [Clostridium sp.]|nr:hypothetical protein [Clostridium sp.]
MSKWIWKFGEFEVYHNLLLHNRRQQYGYPEPVVWKLYAPEPVVCFRKKVTTEGGTIHIKACGDFSTTIGGDKPWEQKKYGGQPEIFLEPGTVTISVRVACTHTFPCLYIDGAVESNESWEADDLSQNWAPVGCYDCFSDAEKTPEVFPFSYQKIDYVKKEILEGGALFDFGKETFARTSFSQLEDKKVSVRFGESRQEALDPVWCVIRFEDTPTDGVLSYPPYAFRYLFVSDRQAEVTAEYEYLPLEYKGEFHCDEDIINQVWDAAAYTFHLNSREFLLDGIKRDRWVWSADAYQSLFVNRYLFFDKELEKRTLIALGGKSPFKMHINTIMDYTFFWIISLYDYYNTYGDKTFLEQIFPQLDEIMSFCLGRTDEDGFMRGKPGDWIFIDWADMDKTGALCGEQILYAKAMESYSAVCRIIGKDDRSCGEKADALRQAIFRCFYDEEKKVFIDSCESGKRNVTRHSNLLAYLFLGCSDQQKKDIYERVVLNDEIAQITTPYFKFYENQVHCMAGNEKLLEDSIRGYYGSMLATGATTLYEEYDPTKSGVEHYAMYGNPYEKSLCHAWSASPIYLLGCYRMGVRNTGRAYSTFDVRPTLGDMKSFTGKAPVPGGFVSVSMNEKEVRVLSDIPGGTLWVEGKRYPLEVGGEVGVDLQK